MPCTHVIDEGVNESSGLQRELPSLQGGPKILIVKAGEGWRRLPDSRSVEGFKSGLDWIAYRTRAISLMARLPGGACSFVLQAQSQGEVIAADKIAYNSRALLGALPALPQPLS